MSPTRQTQKTCPWGHVFHVRHVPTSQTPERALVGTFWCSLFPSLVSNTRKCPCGHFLVLAHLPSPSPLSRTPECARTGTFWCSRTSPLPLPCLEHQNEPVCGSFWCSRTSALPFSRLEHQNEPVCSSFWCS